MCVAIYFVYVRIYLCMYVCIIGGAPSTGFAFCVTPVMYMWLKLIIIINQVLRIIQIAVKSDVKTGRI